MRPPDASALRALAAALQAEPGSSRARALDALAAAAGRAGARGDVEAADGASRAACVLAGWEPAPVRWHAALRKLRDHLGDPQVHADAEAVAAACRTRRADARAHAHTRAE